MYKVIKTYPQSRKEFELELKPKVFKTIEEAKEFVEEKLLTQRALDPQAIYSIRDEVSGEVIKRYDSVIASQAPKSSDSSDSSGSGISPFSTRPMPPGMSGLTKDTSKKEDEKKK